MSVCNKQPSYAQPQVFVAKSKALSVSLVHVISFRDYTRWEGARAHFIHLDCDDAKLSELRMSQIMAEAAEPYF